MKKILVANRSEIAIRAFRAANELGLRTVAVFSNEDKLSLHRFKADEAYLIGEGLGPIAAYLTIDEIIRVARIAEVDAIYPGYGFLAENHDFARVCHDEGFKFIGPSADTLKLLGDKVSARELAVSVGVPVLPASAVLTDDLSDGAIAAEAEAIGLPVMLKASWGGGGRGMRRINDLDQLLRFITEARTEAKAAFGKDEVYFEKLITSARHVEVQILGDQHGNTVHLFERDCSIQRRNQKIVERAPAHYLNNEQRQEISGYALSIARAANYCGAATVEFLLDVDAEKFYFIEVNPRVQVEHTVTEEVTGIDIVKAQIMIAAGVKLGSSESGVPVQDKIVLNGHAIQCRITTEDPENNFAPDYGRITAYRGATGFGIRLDGGTAYSGAIITRYYDPLLEKVTAWGATPRDTASRMLRALREFRIRGVATNLPFLENIISHDQFVANDYTTGFIDNHPELFHTIKRRDRATRLLTYIADVTVNGHPETRNRPRPQIPYLPRVPKSQTPVTNGFKQLLDDKGAMAVVERVKGTQRQLITDTTMRDAHQSLLATRMRTYDLVNCCDYYARELPQIFSLECWGGATFDVAMRFLNEDPWTRLKEIRRRVPNILLQMLLRGANAVGYTNYADNVIETFVARAAASGIDVFRVFDCLNWVENMRVAIDAVIASGKICEGAICYTGDIDNPDRAKYNLDYYVKMAKQLEDAGVHMIAIKDMAGLIKPKAAHKLVSVLKQEIGLPLHFHTHDTSGIGGASVIAASEAGADVVDLAMDSISGLTSQPCLGSVVAALQGCDRDSELELAAIDRLSRYWEEVRGQYLAFESDLRSGASEVYVHEMPGGQFTNLREQARALGLIDKWHEVAKTYGAVNMMFGDIVKVTPSSKVVGDMALSLVAAGLSVEDVLDPDKEIAFPESVVQMLRGDLGQPEGGWPQWLRQKALKGSKPITVRPGSLIETADLKQIAAEMETKLGRQFSDEEFNSYLMYPSVFSNYSRQRQKYGPVEVLPTPVYFYGLKVGDEISVDIEQGKTLIVRCVAIGGSDDQGMARVFFELNGQPRTIKVIDRHSAKDIRDKRLADDTNPDQVGAPFPGVVSSIAVKPGHKIKVGDVLMSIEAMKMETTIHADRSGVIGEVLIKAGSHIDAHELLLTFVNKQ